MQMDVDASENSLKHVAMWVDFPIISSIGIQHFLYVTVTIEDSILEIQNLKICSK